MEKKNEDFYHGFYRDYFRDQFLPKPIMELLRGSSPSFLANQKSSLTSPTFLPYMNPYISPCKGCRL